MKSFDKQSILCSNTSVSHLEARQRISVSRRFGNSIKQQVLHSFSFSLKSCLVNRVNARRSMIHIASATFVKKKKKKSATVWPTKIVGRLWARISYQRWEKRAVILSYSASFRSHRKRYQYDCVCIAWQVLIHVLMELNEKCRK